MSLLIQAIPQWSVVYTTCFETMWPESGEKLNDFLGESQGLSVNLDRLCGLLHWPAQLCRPAPLRLRRRARAPHLTHPHRTAPTSQRTANIPYPPPPRRLEGGGLPSPASPRSLCLQGALGSTRTMSPAPSRPRAVWQPAWMRGRLSPTCGSVWGRKLWGRSF